MRMWSTWLWPFCSHLGETFFVSTGVRVLELLAVSMPPSKVCLQCTAAVPVHTQIQSHALLCQGFCTSVPFICLLSLYKTLFD